MQIGSPKRKDEKPFGIKWPSGPIKALGIFFTYDQSLLYEKNFQEKVDSIKKLTIYMVIWEDSPFMVKQDFPFRANTRQRRVVQPKKKKGRKTPKRTGPLGRTCSRVIV